MPCSRADTGAASTILGFDDGFGPRAAGAVVVVGAGVVPGWVDRLGAGEPVVPAVPVALPGGTPGAAPAVGSLSAPCRSAPGG